MILNQVNHTLKKLMKEFKHSCIDEYLNVLNLDTKQNYSLWKATYKFKNTSYLNISSPNTTNQDG